MIDPKPTKRILRREQRTNQEAAHAWKQAVLVSGPCAVTGRTPTVAHHAVPQRVLRERGLGEHARWDVRNGIPLESRAHERHHSRHRPILMSELPAAVFDFAEDYGLVEYLRRTYPTKEK